ncbi:MAG: hypothetical protein MJZ05_09195 [Fibrobacter sp.]|nr:hypothetical protein [Fibrobacter sp.]
MKRLVLLLLSTLLLCSCANKSMVRYETLAPALEKGGFEGAIQKAKKEQKSIYGDNSKFLYYFDLGTLYHYQGKFKESAEYLDKADQVYDDLYTKSVTNETAAILTNDNIRPYRARPFEVLTLHQMQILNYLAMRDIEGAMVEVRRAQLAQESLYQKDHDKVNDNGFLRYLCALVYEMAGEHEDAAISYINTVKAYHEGNMKLPKEVWEYVNESLVKMGRAGDLNRLGYKPLQATPKATASREKGQEIIVIGYAGHSPILGERRMSGTYVSGGLMNLSYKDSETGEHRSTTIAAPVVSGGNGQTLYIGIALPEKRNLPQTVRRLDVSIDDGKFFKPEMVMNVDAELTKNIEEETPTTMARTAARVAVRTIAAQAAKAAMQTKNTLVNLATSIGTDIAQSQLEQADLRVGLFLPNTICMARFPVDEGVHNVTINSLGFHGETVNQHVFNNVKVAKGQKIFVFVPAIH